MFTALERGIEKEELPHYFNELMIHLMTLRNSHTTGVNQSLVGSIYDNTRLPLSVQNMDNSMY